MTQPRINTDKVEQVIDELNNNFDYGTKTKQVNSAYLIEPRYDAGRDEMGGSIGINSSMKTSGEGWTSEKTFYINVAEADFLSKNAPEPFRNQFNRIASEMKDLEPACKQTVANTSAKPLQFKNSI